jgi:hypothetical protein
MTTAKVLDLDALVPEPAILRFKGREFDVARTPMALAAKGFALRGSLGAEDADQFSIMVDFLAEILQHTETSNDEQSPVTSKWLMESLTTAQLSAMVDFIMSNAFGGPGEVVDAGEPQAEGTD